MQDQFAFKERNLHHSIKIWCKEHKKALILLIFICIIKFVRNVRYMFRPTLGDLGTGSNFLGTNLDWFEVNWILELDLYLGP